MLLDEGFPSLEQLPRCMNVLIDEGQNQTVRTWINGQRIGDPLRDNRYEDDGYRFHDVFHVAYATVLGWSPTLRALLRRKRKSNPAVDEVEDGGRARAIEEGIIAMTFSHAERCDFLVEADYVEYSLLRTIGEMTAHLEVSYRAEHEWSRAILEGFRLWREIRSSGGGRIRANLLEGTLEVVPIGQVAAGEVI